MDLDPFGQIIIWLKAFHNFTFLAFSLFEFKEVYIIDLY